MDGLIIETEALDVFEQMAADELICDSLPSRYNLRFYNWARPGITFGYSQRAAMVRSSLPANLAGLPLVRRPTGGGIVFHETDLTFSFIFHSPGTYFEPAKTYDRLHRAITAAYAKAGISFELLTEPTPSYNTNTAIQKCFAKPVNLDILYNGKKVLGGALRKFGDYMLYQASFQAPDSRTNSESHKQLIQTALGEEFALGWTQKILKAEEKAKMKELAAGKYQTAAWNERI